MSSFLANQISVCSVKENEPYIDLHKPNSKSKIITVLLHAGAKIQVLDLSSLLNWLLCHSLVFFISNCILPSDNSSSSVPKGYYCMGSWFLSKTMSLSQLGWLQSCYPGIPIAGCFSAKSTFYVAEIIGQRLLIWISYAQPKT